MLSCRIHTLGGFQILVNGASIAERLPTRKAETLLAYLFTARRKAVPRDTICAILWPDTDNETARNRLKQVVAVSRRALGSHADLLLPYSADRAALAVGAGVQTDVGDLEAHLRLAGGASTAAEAVVYYRHVVALYSGPFLPKSDEQWAETERERFRHAHRSALLRLLHWHEQQTETEQALEIAWKLHRAEPLDEEAAQDLLRLLASSRQTAHALRLFRQFVARYCKTLGEPPSPAFRAWEARLRTGARLVQTATVHEIPLLQTDAPLDAQRLLGDLRRSGLLETPTKSPSGLPVDRPVLLAALNQVAAQLTETEKTNLRRRHSDLWTGEIRKVAQIWRGPQAAETFARLDDHQNDLSAALHFLTNTRPTDALALATDLHWYWYVRGRHKEGQTHLDRLLLQTPTKTSKARADALLAAGHFANCQGDNQTAFARYGEARRLFRLIGDADGVALTLMREGNAAMEEGLFLRAYQLCREAQVYFRQKGDEPNLVMALNYDAMATVCFGETDEAERAFRDLLILARSVGDERHLSITLQSFALGKVICGRTEAAAQIIGESLCLLLQTQDILGSVYSLQVASSIFASRGQKEIAATALSGSQSLRQIYGFSVPYLERVEPLKFFLPEALALQEPGKQRVAKTRGGDLAHSLPELLQFVLSAL